MSASGLRTAEALEGAAVSTEVFETFDRHALAALQARNVPRVRAADYFSKGPEADATTDEELARWNDYFAKFAKLTDAACLCCGKSLRCPLGMGLFGGFEWLFGGFEWGMVHGEGSCAYCGYPMRGHHIVDGLGAIRNLFLPYHPSGLSFAPEEEP
jgi:hypothetical protein